MSLESKEKYVIVICTSKKKNDRKSEVKNIEEDSKMIE